jgi:HlyD family secretion protein
LNKYSIFILPVLVMLAGCSREPEAQVFNIAQLTQRDIIVSVDAAGIIEPETTVEVKSKASGEILEIHSDTGDLVEVGSLIVQIDKRTPKNSLAQAEAELEAAHARRSIARAQTARAKTLLESGTFNEVDYEQTVLEFANAKAEVVRSQVAVENARIALDDTEVRAPITGTIIEKNVEKGQVISSPTQDVGGGTELLKMADLRSVQVRALVDETDIGKIIPEQTVVIEVAAYPNQPFEGRVLKIEPQAADEEAVTLFSVIITINNESGLLRPGMNAEVEIMIASRFDVPAIPTIALRTMADLGPTAGYVGLSDDVVRAQLSGEQAALGAVAAEHRGVIDGPPSRRGRPGGRPTDSSANEYQFGGRYWLFVLRNGEPYAVNVETGLTDLDYSEVISGIDPSDEIILLPSAGLIRSQNRFRQFAGRFGGVPGISRSDSD